MISQSGIKYILIQVNYKKAQIYIKAVHFIHTSKHETLTQCHFNVGPQSAMLAQH